MNETNLKRIVGAYFPEDYILSILPFGKGHINDTYKLTLKGTSTAFILQRINTDVFEDPMALAINHQKIQNILKDEDHPLMIARLLPDLKNNLIHFDGWGDAWRMTSFIENSYNVEVIEEPKQAFEVGRGFGWFNKICHRLDARAFQEPIKDFHRLGFRMSQLDRAVEEDAEGRLGKVSEIVDFYRGRLSLFSLLEQKTDEGQIPLRVTHNDTKINNLLFCGGKAVAVIDLDTVGPGILHYDFGDALRTGGNTSNEDEKNLEKVDFNMEAFEAFTRGYLEQVGGFITNVEKDYLYLAPRLMAFIMGIRFLADYLNGDVYYKTAYPDHNLSRSIVQKKLIERMEVQEDLMKMIVEKT